MGFSLGDLLAQKFLDKAEQVGRCLVFSGGPIRRRAVCGPRVSTLSCSLTVSVYCLQVDMKRLLKLASFGLLIHGPTGTHDRPSSS